MEKIRFVGLLTLLLFLIPSVNAQIVSETDINVNNVTVVEKSTAYDHFVKIKVGDFVKIFQRLYNYFDANWVEIDVTYTVLQGENLIANFDTTGLHTFWTNKGDWSSFEFFFEAKTRGRVQILFWYNGTYWEQFPTSQPIPFSGIASFSSLTFEITEVELPYIPILLMLTGVAVIVASSFALYYRKRKKERI